MRRVAVLLATLCLLHTGLGYDNPADLPFGTSFLSTLNKAEYTKTEKRDRGRFLKEVYEQASEETKKDIQNEVLPNCYSWWMTETQRTEVEALHVSGDHNTCKYKVREYLNQLPTEKRENVESYWQFCEHLWYKSHSASSHHDHHKGHVHTRRSHRPSRHAAHHDLETKLKNEWKWLTNEQKEEIRKLKTDGKNDEFLLSKVFEYFKNADDKDAAEDGLQTSCGAAILNILGAEKAEVLKAFMANGATPEAYEQKVKELLNSAPSKTLTKNQESCKSVFTNVSRRRRHEGGHHHHTLEDYLESSHLSWLTHLQKESLRKLAQEGKSKEVIQKQALDYYEATTGELREKATSDLQAGCREVFGRLFGEEKANELKTLKEAGASVDDLRKKSDQFVQEIADDQQKEEAKFHAVVCRKAFGVEEKTKRHVHRRRRNHHHGEEHTLEGLFKTYLSWLTEDQRKVLTDLKAAGKTREELQKEVLKYYEDASESVKETARQNMQDGCRKLIIQILGEEKAGELKKMRESGSTLKEVSEKTKQLISELTDNHMKQYAQEYQTVCNKAFSLE